MHVLVLVVELPVVVQSTVRRWHRSINTFFLTRRTAGFHPTMCVTSLTLALKLVMDGSTWSGR
jgi:hypothetical protein